MSEELLKNEFTTEELFDELQAATSDDSRKVLIGYDYGDHGRNTVFTAISRVEELHVVRSDYHGGYLEVNEEECEEINGKLYDKDGRKVFIILGVSMR